MSLKTQIRTEIQNKILQLILENNFSTKNIKDLSNKYKISLQSIYKIIDSLAIDDSIIKTKEGRKIKYSLKTNVFYYNYTIGQTNEDKAFSDHKQLINFLPENCKNIYRYVFTEMFNNAIDHSLGTSIKVSILVSKVDVLTCISDDGIGIFEKIKERFNLDSINQSVFELFKGKTTTDPNHHTGEGIFFSSKCVDNFGIIANGLTFNTSNIENSVLEDKAIFSDAKNFSEKGTTIFFKISLNNKISLTDLFNNFTNSDYGFYKTIVSVKHLEYNEENPIYISRSQAKRLLSGFEKFEEIVFDFKDVKEIGQGFADEIFRVWAKNNPNKHIYPIHANKSVSQMISNAQKTEL